MTHSSTEFHLDKEAQEVRYDDKNSLGERLKIDLQGGTLAQILNHQMGRVFTVAPDQRDSGESPSSDTEDFHR